MTAKTILTTASDASLATEIITSYSEVESQFTLQKWKVSALDAGHFVESVRRFIELKLFGAYTAIGTSLPVFNEATLKRYEQAVGDESYRIVLPRILYAIYTVRNKRGVGHVGLVKPNQIDARLILQQVKWCLAELIRLNSALSLPETEKLIDAITVRQIEGLWKVGNVTRVLSTKLKADEKILLLLYDKSPQTSEELRNAIKYSNKSTFVKLLKVLDHKMFLEFKTDSTCILSPLGVAAAERIAQKAKLTN